MTVMPKNIRQLWLRLMSNKLSRIGLVVLGIGVGALVAKRLMPLPAKPLEMVSQNSFTVKAEAKGRLKALEEEFLTIKKGGRLDKVFVNVGDSVRAGTIIAVVDETTLRAGVESAMSSYRLAASELGRVERLRRTRATTLQELDQVRNNWLTRRADLETARQRLEDGLVRASFDGTVATIAYKTGEFIPDGARVAIVEDRAGANIVVKMPQAVRGKIPAEGTIMMMHDGRTETAQPFEVSFTVLNAGSDFDNADFDVQIVMSPMPEGFATGESVTVSIALETIPNVWTIPSSALVDRGGTLAVAVLTDHKLRLEPVDVLGVNGSNTVLRSRPKNQTVWPLANGDMQRAIIGGKSVRLATN